MATEVVMVQAVREALHLVLVLSLPLLGVSLAVGLVSGVVQAVTQVQEPGLSAVPRLVLGLLALFVAGGWMGAQLLRYSLRWWRLFSELHL